MNKQKILFVLNPNAGARTQTKIPNLIEKYIDKNNFQFECVFTEYAGHAIEIAKKAVQDNFYAVIAVGGDGTVNEIARVLRNTKTALGIIPMGSGNGLARDLGIPMKTVKAIKNLNTHSTTLIDSCLINHEIPFFCTAGVGFDAHCAEIFSKAKNRGLLTYVRVGWQEYWKYKPLKCSFAGNDYEVFSLTFANAKQFGNNAYIAPKAENNDGFIDCTILNPPPTYLAPKIVSQLFGGTLNESPYVEIYRGTEFLLESESNFLIHYDGEPLRLGTNRLIIKILEKSLKVLI